MAARLFCKIGELAGSEFHIDRDATIGTSSDNSIQLHPKLISRRHARISFDADRGCYCLEDLGSRNGTQVDGIWVREREYLDDLNVVTFAGMFDFFFQVVPDGHRIAPPAPATEAQPGTVVESNEAALPDNLQGPAEPSNEGDVHTVYEQPDMPMPSLGQDKQPPAAGSDKGRTEIHESFGDMPALGQGRDEKKPAGATDRERTIQDEAEAPLPKLGDQSGDATVSAPAPQQSRRAYLLIEGENRMHEISESTLEVGRSASCAVSINQPSVSRRHSELVIRGGEVIIKDVGSRNGTFVNDQTIKKETVLSEPCELRFGDVKARLVFK
jgi:pSer/pThr/pTyr-binding forkhead associated (FHA) protein